MRLSEAIREGAKLTREIRRQWSRRIQGDCYTCAVGAAFFAATGRDLTPTGEADDREHMTDDQWDQEDKRFRDLGIANWKELVSLFPVCAINAEPYLPTECGGLKCERKMRGLAGMETFNDVPEYLQLPRTSVLDTASHLFERHRWSREAVAEWIETIENKLEQEARTESAEEPALDREGVEARQ